jgi:hypothetical protein
MKQRLKLASAIIHDPMTCAPKIVPLGCIGFLDKKVEESDEEETFYRRADRGGSA